MLCFYHVFLSVSLSSLSWARVFLSPWDETTIAIKSKKYICSAYQSFAIAFSSSIFSVVAADSVIIICCCLRNGTQSTGTWISLIRCVLPHSHTHSNLSALIDVKIIDTWPVFAPSLSLCVRQTDVNHRKYVIRFWSAADIKDEAILSKYSWFAPFSAAWNTYWMPLWCKALFLSLLTDTIRGNAIPESISKCNSQRNQIFTVCFNLVWVLFYFSFCSSFCGGYGWKWKVETAFFLFDFVCVCWTQVFRGGDSAWQFTGWWFNQGVNNWTLEISRSWSDLIRR